MIKVLENIFNFIDRHIVLVVIGGVVVYSIIATAFQEMEVGTIPDWVGGIGSLAAVIVALYLSKKQEKPIMDFEIISTKPIYENNQTTAKTCYEIKIKNYSNLAVRLLVIGRHKEILGLKDGVSFTPCGIDIDDETNFVKTIKLEVLANSSKINDIVFYDTVSRKYFTLEQPCKDDAYTL